MMYLRTAALKWFESKYGLGTQGVYTSKYYQSFESWPKKEVWWLQIPIKAIEQHKEIHLLCQTSPDSSTFLYLKVPSSFFKEHLSNFDRVKDIIHMYLSPERSTYLKELRGKGSLNFDRFLIAK